MKCSTYFVYFNQSDGSVPPRDDSNELFERVRVIFAPIMAIVEEWKSHHHDQHNPYLAHMLHKMDPPRLVVVGWQSTGKSTLLSRVSNLDFFPAGVGMTTRACVDVSTKWLPLERLRQQLRELRERHPSRHPRDVVCPRGNSVNGFLTLSFR